MALGPISKDLIEKAVASPSDETRALATQAIGRWVRDATLSEGEARLARQIFDVLSRDVAEEVRRALAVTLRLSKNLPKSVANRLINDVDSIAVPLLSTSPMVDDDDLILVFQSRAAAKMQAVAGRQGLSERVSGAVINFGDRAAVATLAANDTALISKADAERLVDLAEQDDLIWQASLRRQDMPQNLAARLIDLQIADVDEALKPETSDHAQIASDTGERARASWTAADWSPDALNAYVTALFAAGKLDEAVIARSAGQGDWRFAQLALAHLVGISATKAGMIVLDSRPFALSALLQRSGLGEAACELVMASAVAFRDIERSGASISRVKFQRLMTERVATHPAADIHGDVWMDWLDEGLGPRAI